MSSCGHCSCLRLWFLLRSLLRPKSADHAVTSDQTAPTQQEHPLVGPRGKALAFAWGAAEASFFFLVPDILLTWVAMKAPRRVWLHLVLTVVGAVLAGVLMYAWSAHSTTAQSFVAAVPRVSAAMIKQAKADLRQEGAWGAMRGPARGIPYKVYAVQAPLHGVAAIEFAAVSMLARSWRMVLLTLAFAAVGVALRRWGWVRWGTPFHAVFWVVSVAMYWANIG
jgi:hypothetical protein